MFNDSFLYTGITSASQEPTGSVREKQRNEKQRQRQLLQPQGIEIVIAKLQLDREKELLKSFQFTPETDLEEVKIQLILRDRHIAYLDSLISYFKSLLPKEKKSKNETDV